jgi:hypothetical protein
VSDLTETWAALLREADEARREAERAKVEAMTDEERERYFERMLIESIVNMP